MAESNEIEAFIAERLASISLQDEAITEYFARIIEEESMEEPEKREAITELLADVTEEPTGTVIDNVFEFWNKMKQEEAKKTQEEKEKILEAAKERAALKVGFDDFSNDREAPLSMSSRHVVKNMTKEERKKRDALLAQYAYDLDEMVEGEENLRLFTRTEQAAVVNEARQRSEMKKASDNEKERNRLALEKQRLAQEKERRRTQKQEKRRM
ncbi:hypothetical protein BGZ65_010736 [Modicella reniformis]|uniref:CCDC43 PWI-like domain-containing protein n=1 Tax=Modicella reniformis TaxID=1440133 RepID=A0A9P6IMU6_9FUNG|nr:hypothetical protein BGZ65_010736 [Modicella reniformis]